MNRVRMNKFNVKRTQAQVGRAQSIVPAVQELAREWVGRTAEGSSAQANAVVRWALTRINHADVPSVVYGVVLTLTGKKKAAKQAQRTAAKAVKEATVALSRKTRMGYSPRNSVRRGGWLAAVAGLIVGASAVYAWRMVMPFGEPKPR